MSAGEGDASAAIQEAMSVLDKAAKRNVIHQNAASRHKSRLMSQLNKLGAGLAEEKPKRGRKSPAKKSATKRASKTSR